MAKKKAATKTQTKCPISRKEFLEDSKPFGISVGENRIVVDPKEFSSGSFGWYGGGKVLLQVNGQDVKCQVGINVIAVGSKEAK